MVTCLLLGNIIQMHVSFFTKILNTTNVGLETDLVVYVIKKPCITKASLKSVNFTFFLGQNSFLVIFLCFKVKPFWAITNALVLIIRKFKKCNFVFVLQKYIM